MATALKSIPALHPETRRLLDDPTWTADPAVKPLFAAIAALVPVGQSMRELSADRPSINRCIADDIGGLSVVTEMAGRMNEWVDRVRPSGVIASIWEELEALRSRWIDARLTAEGLRADMGDHDRWYEAKMALENEAPSVAGAWAAYQRGEG